MTHKKFLGFADDWRPWVTIAYFGLVGTVVALFFLFSKTNREESARQAVKHSADQAKVTACAASARSAPVLEEVLRSIRNLATNSLLTNEAALDATPANDPLTIPREQSVIRAKKAQAALGAFLARVKARTPTLASCRALARRLGAQVPPST